MTGVSRREKIRTRRAEGRLMENSLLQDKQATEETTPADISWNQRDRSGQSGTNPSEPRDLWVSSTHGQGGEGICCQNGEQTLITQKMKAAPFNSAHAFHPQGVFKAWGLPRWARQTRGWPPSSMAYEWEWGRVEEGRRGHITNRNIRAWPVWWRKEGGCVWKWKETQSPVE